MVRVLEAVPNVSEGRDPEKIRALVETVQAFDVDLLDWSSDPDHHRSVLTYIGEPDDVEAASLAVARFAIEHFDLREHRGVHPRVGALDVLPFVPLHDLTMQDAASSARRVGRAIADLGVPIYFYGAASDPPGRALAELRRGGYEGMAGGFSPGREPDLPVGARHPHPSAGVTCVGARRVLLAWNVFVSGISLGDAREVASKIRERDGGFVGLRALGLRLEDRGRLQISMNLEDPERTTPLEVYEAIEAEVLARGGTTEGTEVIGMMTDTLVLPATADRLGILDPGFARVLSRRVAQHVAARTAGRPETSDITE